MGQPSSRLIAHISERADSVDHLLRAPLCTRSRASYRRYLADVYGFVAAVEDVTAGYSRLARRRTHSTWLANELAALDVSAAQAAAVLDLATRSLPTLPIGQLESLGWMFVVERTVRVVPAMRTLVERVVPLFPSSTERAAPPNTQELHFGLADFARYIDRTVDDERAMLRVRSGSLAALDSLEAWALASAAVMAQLQPSSVQFA